MRFRYVFMSIFSIVGLLLLFLMDPDVGLIEELPYGAGFIATMASLLKVSIFIAMLHLSRRALFDYIDLSRYFEKALETSVGAGNALIGVGMAMMSIAIVIWAAVS